MPETLHGSSLSAFGSIVRKADVRVPACRDFKGIADPSWSDAWFKDGRCLGDELIVTCLDRWPRHGATFFRALTKQPIFRASETAKTTNSRDHTGPGSCLRLKPSSTPIGETAWAIASIRRRPLPSQSLKTRT